MKERNNLGDLYEEPITPMLSTGRKHSPKNTPRKSVVAPTVLPFEIENFIMEKPDEKTYESEVDQSSSGDSVPWVEPLVMTNSKNPRTIDFNSNPEFVRTFKREKARLKSAICAKRTDPQLLKQPCWQGYNKTAAQSLRHNSAAKSSIEHKQNFSYKLKRNHELLVEDKSRNVV